MYVCATAAAASAACAGRAASPVGCARGAAAPGPAAPLLGLQRGLQSGASNLQGSGSLRQPVEVRYRHGIG